MPGKRGHIEVWPLFFCLLVMTVAANDPASSSSSSENNTWIDPLNNPDVATQTEYNTLLAAQLLRLLIQEGSSFTAKDPQDQRKMVGTLISVLQSYEQRASHEETQKSAKVKPRVNILTDPSYAEPMLKVNLVLGLFFCVFIVIALIYDATRISKEARRRSAAVHIARMKKKQLSGKPQTLVSKYRQSITSLFRTGLRKTSSTPHTNTDDSVETQSDFNVQELKPMATIPETRGSAPTALEVKPFDTETESLVTKVSMDTP